MAQRENGLGSNLGVSKSAMLKAATKIFFCMFVRLCILSTGERAIRTGYKRILIKLCGRFGYRLRRKWRCSCK